MTQIFLFYSRKKSNFLPKIAIYLFFGLHKYVQATGEAFSTQKRKCSTSEHEISSLLSSCWGSFFALLYPDPDLHSQCGFTTLAENKAREI
jgi:hypothetical protein